MTEKLEETIERYGEDGKLESTETRMLDVPVGARKYPPKPTPTPTPADEPEPPADPPPVDPDPPGNPH